MTQGDIMYRVRDVRLGEDADYYYTAATNDPRSSVYRICKRTRRRKYLGPRDRTPWSVAA